MRFGDIAGTQTGLACDHPQTRVIWEHTECSNRLVSGFCERPCSDQRANERGSNGRLVRRTPHGFYMRLGGSTESSIEGLGRAKQHPSVRRPGVNRNQPLCEG
jgi:hypothetical protein